METYAVTIAVAVAFFAGVASARTWLLTSRARGTKGTAEGPANEAASSHRLLLALLDAAPAAVVVLSDAGRIVLTNPTARAMFAEGRDLEGQNFLTLIGSAPPALREAMLGDEDALFTVGAGEGDAEIFRLAKRPVHHDGRPHTLLTVEPLTREIRRQEVEIWKKLLRTISHELNNSLAPISSLVHSARLIVDKLDDPAQLPKLQRVFDTIGDRTKHLQEFLEGYVSFARLPKPRPQEVAWREPLARVRDLWSFTMVGDPSAKKGWFDAAQVEQVLINLLKNAHESGSPREDITLEVIERERGAFDVVVCDRGPGMSEEVLAGALLPFYSTKERGTGLGLALCREIVEAHGGKLRIQNREDKGLAVTCSFPGREAPPAATTTRLTLTHG